MSQTWNWLEETHSLVEETLWKFKLKSLSPLLTPTAKSW